MSPTIVASCSLGIYDFKIAKLELDPNFITRIDMSPLMCEMKDDYRL